MARSEANGKAKTYHWTCACAERTGLWLGWRRRRSGRKFRASIGHDELAQTETQNYRAVISLERSADIERRHGVSGEKRCSIAATEMQEACASLCEKPVFSIALAGPDTKQTAGLPNYGGVKGESGKGRDVVLPVGELGI